MVNVNRDKQLQTIDAIQEQIKDEIELALTVEDGYMRKFQVPRTIMGTEFNLSIYENMLSITFMDEDYDEALPQPSVGGFCFKDSNYNYYNLTVMRQAGLVSISSCNDCSYSYAVCLNAEKNNWCDWLSQPGLFPGLNETCCSDNCLCC